MRIQFLPSQPFWLWRNVGGWPGRRRSKEVDDQWV
jgi:hypothetical protein